MLDKPIDQFVDDIMARVEEIADDPFACLEVSLIEYKVLWDMGAITRRGARDYLRTQKFCFDHDGLRGTVVRVTVAELSPATLPVLLKHYWETLKHKGHVMRFLLRVCKDLVVRGVVHDWTKFVPAEAHRFAQVLELMEGSSYRDETYEAVRTYLGPALEHHYANNSHHPEFWEEGFDDMGLLDILEMLCDWKAATLRHEDGDILASVKQNADRFGYDAEWVERFQDLFFDIDAVDNTEAYGE